MMNITLRSKVNGELFAISERFDERLFIYLLPPGAQLIVWWVKERGYCSSKITPCRRMGE
jgi:hypothetical protein